MKISVITVTYQSVGTLEEAMRSVLRQSWPDVEYIVVDGGSTDGTVETIRRMEPEFNGRLRWISEPDHGIYDAMNKGIRMAAGEVVGILNSDDFFSAPDVLERVSAAFASDAGLEGVYGDVRYVEPENTARTVRHYSSAGFTRKKLVYGLMPAHPSFYARKTCFDRFGLYDTRYRISADYDMFVRLIWVGNIRTRYMPFDFVTMRNGGASSSGFSARWRIMREHLRSAREHGMPSSFLLQSLRYFGKIADLLRR